MFRTKDSVRMRQRELTGRMSLLSVGRGSLRLLAAVLTLAALTSPSCSAQRESARRIVWGKAVGGLQAGLAFAKPTSSYASWEQIPLEVYVRNLTDRPISLEHPAGYGALDFGPPSVTNADTKKVPFDARPSIGALHVRSRTIQPGEVVMAAQPALRVTGAEPPEDMRPAAARSRPLPSEWWGSSADVPIYYGPPGRYQVHQTCWFLGRTGAGEENGIHTGTLDVVITRERAGAAAAEPPAIQNLAQAPVAWGKPVNGVQAGLLFLAGKDHYVAGERMRYAVILRNSSDRLVNVAYQVAYPAYPKPVIEDPDGRKITATPVTENDARGMMDVRLEGLTYDHTHSPSVNGPERLSSTEIKPGGAVIGYYLAGVTVPEAWAAKPGRFHLQQTFPAGLKGQGPLDTMLETGALEFEVFASGGGEGGVKPKPQPQVTADGISWGPTVEGLQAGIRFTEKGPSFRHGDTVWFEYMVRNSSSRPVTLVYSNGSVYLSPPPQALPVGVGDVPKPGVKGATGQIERPLTRTLRPRETFLLGTQNVRLRSGIRSLRSSPDTYPEMTIAPGEYVLKQPFPFEVAGRKIDLVSGPLRLQVRGDEAGIAWGPAKEGVQVGIGFENGDLRYAIGETAILHVYLRNTSGKRKQFGLKMNVDHLMPTVLDDNGQRVPVETVMNTLLPHTVTVNLPPGEMVIVDSPELEITGQAEILSWREHQVIAKPGRYRVRVDRFGNYGEDDSVPGRAAIPSGELSMEVIERR
jgi:hypothetical protein